ncbi:MAG TPA: NACHT domain-containing protein [Actinomycetes bacterium]|nr:NACHT domain-containing protein [Actinomycetes bacterium]
MLAVAAVALMGLVWLARTGELGRSDKLAVVGIAVGVVGALLAIPQSRAAILELRRPPAVPADDQAALESAAERLAAAVRAQWQAEAGLRGLHRPEPLRLTWTATARPVAAPAHTITAGIVAGRVVRLRLHGHLDEVADSFLALPHRRLVVLGAPGAGKTVLAMLLTLALLGRRQPNEPVPVLLGLSRWDPTAEHLHAWLARRLGEDYPATRSSGFGPDVPQRLLAAGRVLPLLDGLDELPDDVRAIAVAELDRAHGAQPLVLTCRSEEFERAVATGGTLTAAAVVELEPVAAGQAAAFLQTTAPPAVTARWDEVAGHLHANPEGDLACALSTPLLVALARAVYASPARDPAELVALARAGGRTAVQDRLLEGFIPAAFAALPPAPGSLAPSRRWDPQAARRWLTVLAVHLDRQHTRDLAWWQLHRLLPARTVGMLVGLVFGLVVGLVSGLVLELFTGVLIGLTVGTVIALVVGFRGRAQAWEAPAQVATRVWGRLGRLALGLMGVSAVILVFVVLGELGVRRWTGLEGGLILLFLLGLAGVLDDVLRRPVDTTLAVTPRSVYHRDRIVTIVRGLIGGLTLGLAFGLADRFSGGPAVGFTSGLAVGLVLGAWGRFTLVRGWLALRGHLPWRLLGFLDDAHRLGVLRQAGAVYQFRHALLHDHLAASGAPPSTRHGVP